MKYQHLTKFFIFSAALTFSLFTPLVHAAESIIWPLWPNAPAGNQVALAPEYDKTTDKSKLVSGQRVIRLTNVSKPTLAIYKPEKQLDKGTALIIAPGGGTSILAYDLEGTEIAQWLNSIGITAIILKYRVPGKAFNKERPWLSVAQDGQRAVSLVRGRYKELGINPDKIGVIGFSAGGIAVAFTSVMNKRTYEPVDQYDTHSFLANFAAPIYMGGLPDDAVISKQTPPFFMVITHDDKYSSLNVIDTYTALKKGGASAELHIYESGGHGYGLRKTGLPVANWPKRMEEWMTKMKFL